MIIRKFKQKDYSILKEWWNFYKETPPSIELLPEDTTFVIEHDNTLILSVTLYLTNSKYVCFVEHYIGNPYYKGQARKDCGKILLNHIEEFAKNKGYKNFICNTKNKKLTERYKEMGFKLFISNVDGLVKEL